MNGAKMVLASHFSAEAFLSKAILEIHWRARWGNWSFSLHVYAKRHGNACYIAPLYDLIYVQLARSRCNPFIVRTSGSRDKWLRRLSANTLGVPKNSPPKPISIHHQSADLESQPDYTCDTNLDFGSTCGYCFAILSSRSQRKPIWIMRCDE